MSSDGPILPGTATLPPMDEGTALPSRGAGSRRSSAPTAQTRRRFAVVNAFVDVALRDILPSDGLVWLVLWRDTKPNGLARTSQADMARRTGLALSTVKRAIKRLVAAGLLTVAYRGGLRRGPSVYRVHGVRRDGVREP